MSCTSGIFWWWFNMFTVGHYVSVIPDIFLSPVLYRQSPVSDYDPVHFVRCHFGDKEAKKQGHTSSDPTDDVTPVWSAAFEPDPANPGVWHSGLFEEFNHYSGGRRMGVSRMLWRSPCLWHHNWSWFCALCLIVCYVLNSLLMWTWWPIRRAFSVFKTMLVPLLVIIAKKNSSSKKRLNCHVLQTRLPMWLQHVEATQFVCWTAAQVDC